MRRDVQHDMDSTLPEYTKARDRIKAMLELIVTQLDQMATAGKATDIAKPMKDYFASAHDRYQKMADEVRAYKDRLDKLPGVLKVDEVIDSIRPDSIVIFGPTAVKVVGS